jgi:hypothetical protein
MFRQSCSHLLATDLRAAVFAFVPLNPVPEDLLQQFEVTIHQIYQLDTTAQLVLFLADEFCFSSGVLLLLRLFRLFLFGLSFFMVDRPMIWGGNRLIVI